MKHSEFDKLFEEIVARCRNKLSTKSKEYSTSDDKLHNFKRAAQMRDTTPEKALIGMSTKHEVSIDDIINNIGRGILPTIEMLEEKITDELDYLILLEAIIKERMKNDKIR